MINVLFSDSIRQRCISAVTGKDAAGARPEDDALVGRSTAADGAMHAVAVHHVDGTGVADGKSRVVLEKIVIRSQAKLELRVCT